MDERQWAPPMPEHVLAAPVWPRVPEVPAPRQLPAQLAQQQVQTHRTARNGRHSGLQTEHTMAWLHTTTSSANLRVAATLAPSRRIMVGGTAAGRARYQKSWSR